MKSYHLIKLFSLIIASYFLCTWANFLTRHRQNSYVTLFFNNYFCKKKKKNIMICNKKNLTQLYFMGVSNFFISESLHCLIHQKKIIESQDMNFHQTSFVFTSTFNFKINNNNKKKVCRS